MRNCYRLVRLEYQLLVRMMEADTRLAAFWLLLATITIGISQVAGMSKYFFKLNFIFLLLNYEGMTTKGPSKCFLSIVHTRTLSLPVPLYCWCLHFGMVENKKNVIVLYLCYCFTGCKSSLVCPMN